MRRVEFGHQAQQVLQALCTGNDHFFITGRAGTGKTTLMKHFKEATSKRLVVLASTGVAALQLGGQTIHSFFRFFIDITPEKEK